MPLFPICHPSVPTSQLLCALVLVSPEAFEGLPLGSGATCWYRELDTPEVCIPSSLSCRAGLYRSAKSQVLPQDTTALLLPYLTAPLPYWILLGYFLNRGIFFLLLFLSLVLFSSCFHLLLFFV